jgi:hypothetical protein
MNISEVGILILPVVILLVGNVDDVADGLKWSGDQWRLLMY